MAGVNLPFEIPTIAVGVVAARKAVEGLVADLRAMAARAPEGPARDRANRAADYWQGVLDSTDLALTLALAGEELLQAGRTLKAPVNPDVSDTF